ncbi:MAG: hypothetical protein ABL949_16695 [Fimbriimonadaceae bacterium]
MKRIPADIEQLIWLIAESGDSAAAQEFEHRFPEYKFELNRRMSTVKSLKGSKPSSSAAIPTFQPSIRRSGSSPWKRVGVGVASSLAVLVLALGSYSLTKSLQAKPVVKPPTITHSVTRPFQPEQKLPTNNMTPTVPPTPEGTTSRQPTFNETGTKVLEPYQKPNSVSIEGAPLHDVIQLIASTCGFKVTLLPKLENPDVSVKYERISGEEMLIQLGKQYGFTPMYQGNNEFYIVPALSFTDPGR